MATIDYGLGEQEFICTAWTQVLYEHEFVNDTNKRITGDMVSDIMGVQKIASNDFVRMLDDGSLEATIDYTRENRPATIRALWAMLKTASEIAKSEGKMALDIPAYEQWTRNLLKCDIDFSEISLAVGQELQRGLFRASPSSSEGWQEEE